MKIGFKYKYCSGFGRFIKKFLDVFRRQSHLITNGHLSNMSWTDTFPCILNPNMLI